MPSELTLAAVAIITTTVGTQYDAQRLAQAAVKEHLAACAQVEEVTSHYVWDSKLEEGTEWRIVFKTSPQGVLKLWPWLKAAHPYDVPQLLVRTEHGEPAYAAWVAEYVDAKK